MSIQRHPKFDVDPQHPGSVLAQKFMQPARLTQNGLARTLGIPAQRIGDIVLGRRGITVDTAVRLAEYFGNDPRYWLDLQREYDLAGTDQVAIRRQVRPPENLPGRVEGAFGQLPIAGYWRCDRSLSGTARPPDFEILRRAHQRLGV